MDLSSTQKFSFPLKNSFNGPIIDAKDSCSSSEAQIRANKSMLTMINREKLANGEMVVDEDNDRYVDEEDEEDEGNSGSEKGTLSTQGRKKYFRDNVSTTDDLSLRTG